MSRSFVSRRRSVVAVAAAAGAALGLALLPVPASAVSAATLSRTSGPLGTTIKVTGTCTDLLDGYTTTARIGLYYTDAFLGMSGYSTFHQVSVKATASGAFSGSIKVGAAVTYTTKGPGPAQPGADRLRKPKAGDTLKVQVLCNQSWTANYISAQYGTKSFTVTKSSFVLKTAPKATGTAKVGKVLTATKGTWSPTPSSYSYQWKRAGKAISKATKKTYRTVTKDKGKKITVTVKVKKTGYFTKSKTSKARTIG